MVNHSGNKKIVLKSASDRSCQWEKLELSFMVQYNSGRKMGLKLAVMENLVTNSIKFKTFPKCSLLNYDRSMTCEN